MRRHALSRLDSLDLDARALATAAARRAGLSLEEWAAAVLGEDGPGLEQQKYAPAPPRRRTGSDLDNLIARMSGAPHQKPRGDYEALMAAVAAESERQAQDQASRTAVALESMASWIEQAEIRLNGKMTELEKLNANARQALMMAADAEKAGNAAKATQYTSAAETIANQLIQVEKDVEGLKAMVMDATQASDQAKAAVAQNGRLLQEKLAQKNKLLSQLEQSRMQEEMNKAMSQLNETVGDDVPSLKEVQDKIEARYAKAKAMSELGEVTVENRILEIEQATANVEAQSRLSQLRNELGLESGTAAAPAASTAEQVEAPRPTPG